MFLRAFSSAREKSPLLLRYPLNSTRENKEEEKEEEDGERKKEKRKKEFSDDFLECGHACVCLMPECRDLRR